MRRILLAIVLLPLCAWLALWAGARSARRRSESAQWPERLGTVNDVPSHYPDAETSAAAAELLKLAEPLGVGKAKQPLPDQHDPRLDQIRDHILNGGPIAWRVRFRLGEHAPMPNLFVHINLTKVFVRRAETTQSWEELHAAWLLNHELWDRPELISVLIALADTRRINATAAKMPLPPPAWFAELQSFDYRRRFAKVFQAEAWADRRMMEEMFGQLGDDGSVFSPWVNFFIADSLRVMRKQTTQLMGTMSCDLANDPVRHTLVVALRWNWPANFLPSIFDDWKKLARFRAELEATSKIIALRSGQTPSSSSTCSDGTWIIRPDSIAFSRDIAVAHGAAYPLMYKR